MTQWREGAKMRLLRRCSSIALLFPVFTPSFPRKRESRRRGDTVGFASERAMSTRPRDLQSAESSARKAALARVTLSHKGLTGVGLRRISPTPEPR